MINPPLIYNDQWIEDALRVAQAAKHAHVPRFKEKFGPPTVEGMLLELKRLRETLVGLREAESAFGGTVLYRRELVALIDAALAPKQEK